MSDRLIDANSVGHHYRRRTALWGVDLSVKPGEIVALVGPNGSGKTTLLKILAGFIRPKSGRVAVFGHNPHRHRVQVMRQARFAFAPPPLYDSLTGLQHLRHLSRAGFPRQDRPQWAEPERALAAVGLSHRADDRVRTYSFGMRQRLALALCLLPLPRLLVLDEPADGLDPLAVLELRQTLCDLRDQHQVSIVLSSHLLIDLETLADQILVLNDGRTIYAGSPRGLLENSARTTLHVEGDIGKAVAILEQNGLKPEVKEQEITIANGRMNLEQTAALLRGDGIRLVSFYEKQQTLEQALRQRWRAAATTSTGGRAMSN